MIDVMDIPQRWHCCQCRRDFVLYPSELWRMLYQHYRESGCTRFERG